MASLSNDPGGRRRIQFVDADGNRKTIRLGKMSKRQAESVKLRVEDLVAAKLSNGSPSDETSRWLAEIDQVLYDKLAAVELAERIENVTLADFIDSYVESRTDLKPRTIAKFNATRDYLVEHFGNGCTLKSITPGGADDWRLRLINKGLGENTIRKHTQIAKQLLNAAARKRLIDSNPFSDLKSTVLANPERFYFVTREEALRVLDACPDSEWRLIFALSRFGGLRCPSEHLALTWDCVDWNNGRLRIPSAKTEHHLGKGSRIIPIFADLRPYLEEAFDAAEAGAVYVISRYRSSNINLRTQLKRIIIRSGLAPWPKLFQNLRSTRQTELSEQFPQHVVCDWIGNTNAVAAKHYLQVTDDHFLKAAQNPAQSMHAGGRLESHTKKSESKQSVVLQHLASFGDSKPQTIVAEEGLEPPTRGL